MAFSNFSRLTFRLCCKRNRPILRLDGVSYFNVRMISQTIVNHILPTVHESLPLSNESNVNSFYFTEESSQWDRLSKTICSKPIFSDHEFEEIRKQFISEGGHFSDSNFDSIFVRVCGDEKAFSIGKAYFKWRYLQGKCNISTIGKFMKLCHDFPSDCTEEDKLFIINLYEELLTKYPILDYITSTNAACGLSITNKWKEGLKLLEMCKISGSPTGSMYSAVIQAAFKHRELDIALKLIHEMTKSNKFLTEGVLESWMEATGYSNKGFCNILYFLEQYDIHPNIDVANVLLKFHKHIKGESKTSKITTIHRSGRCCNCNHQLKPLTITDDEFSKLRDAFLNPVLLGKDIFLKTKPEELKDFLSFLKNSGKVDVVLDGLNIAYAKDHSSFNKGVAAKMVTDVVKHFVKDSKKIIVLGRKHMQSWPKDYMNYIKRNSSMFLAENVSADDPLLLYAAMNSGLGTKFVSRDQMRAHKFLLKNPELRSLFSRWQQKHQYYLKHVNTNGKVLLVDPLPYLIKVQESQPNIWHIPISTSLEGIPGHLVPISTKWMCLR